MPPLPADGPGAAGVGVVAGDAVGAVGAGGELTAGLEEEGCQQPGSARAGVALAITRAAKELAANRRLGFMSDLDGVGEEGPGSQRPRSAKPPGRTGPALGDGLM